MNDSVKEVIEHINQNKKYCEIVIKRCEKEIKKLEDMLVIELTSLGVNHITVTNLKVEIARLETVCNCKETNLIEFDKLIEIFKN